MIDSRSMLAIVLLAAGLTSCDDSMAPPIPGDIDTAERVTVDRFSDAAATLFKRSQMPSLPAAGAPVDLDQEPFITQGLGPGGQVTRYYNFDVMPSSPAPIWVLYREGSDVPVENQLNIIDQVPGSPGYSDFWQVNKVTVPADYVANTVTSLQNILDAGYQIQATNVIVNCPVVPEGSVGREGAATNGLTRGWYRGKLVFYFNFDEAPLFASDDGSVPVSEIYVSFNVNPDQEGGGSISGFKTETGTVQTHNVVEDLPGDDDYSPLWAVLPYDNESFDAVHDLDSAEAAPGFFLEGLVNCPIVFVGPVPQAGGAKRASPRRPALQ